MDNSEPKDQNVYSFMLQLVQEKFGDEAEVDFLNNEADRIYDLFGEVLLQYFGPLLPKDKTEEFDQLIESGAGDDDLMGFLMEHIDNLEMQIMEILLKFREDYMDGNLEMEGDPDSADSGFGPDDFGDSDEAI